MAGSAASRSSQIRASGRLAGLDVFRGVTIAAMLVVNNPGDWSHVFAPLRHAAWHGCTPTDLIFPFFLFIVGVSVAFSSRLARAEAGERGRALGAVLRRAVMLMGIGLALNFMSLLTLPEFRLDQWRIPGVLQRIAVCYFVVAALALHVRVVWQAVFAAGILLGYAWLVTHASAGGSGEPLSMSGNIVAHVDRAAVGWFGLGVGHLYRGGVHDPEGLLSTLPAIVTTLMGLWAGRLIRGRPRAPGVFLRSPRRERRWRAQAWLGTGWAGFR